MQLAISESLRRRKTQEQYNKEHGITPASIKKEIKDQLIMEDKEKKSREHKDTTAEGLRKAAESFVAMGKKERKELLAEIETQMNIYADMLEFEKAADMRDLLNSLKQKK